MTRVLPLPAPASTSKGPSRCITASRCTALSLLNIRGDLTFQDTGDGRDIVQGCYDTKTDQYFLGISRDSKNSNFRWGDNTSTGCDGTKCRSGYARHGGHSPPYKNLLSPSARTEIVGVVVIRRAVVVL